MDWLSSDAAFLRSRQRLYDHAHLHAQRRILEFKDDERSVEALKSDLSAALRRKLRKYVQEQKALKEECSREQRALLRTLVELVAEKQQVIKEVESERRLVKMMAPDPDQHQHHHHYRAGKVEVENEKDGGDRLDGSSKRKGEESQFGGDPDHQHGREAQVTTTTSATSEVFAARLRARQLLDLELEDLEVEADLLQKELWSAQQQAESQGYQPKQPWCLTKPWASSLVAPGASETSSRALVDPCFVAETELQQKTVELLTQRIERRDLYESG
eukprot:CAMPEP_0178989772 /NCGR_PEP_ID=MMETSP0795-20121207/4563_1 /TAXON_ID=88552 /ORGANISM="Amoebophrya sp., Strain Ameob2" /LENGTH=272 /DNA_ID=CAMNT_0020681217 /DNA_START=1122 /DNA_END=1937 /DNA_ORIENTATION=-